MNHLHISHNSCGGFVFLYQVVVGIQVLDINDNDPILLNLPYNTSVSEGAPIHTSITQVRAQDSDSGRNALLTYSITASNTDGAFYINETVRDISTKTAEGKNR